MQSFVLGPYFIVSVSESWEGEMTSTRTGEG